MVHRGFWRELKRRHVYRVAVAYAIVGWLLIQVVTQVFPVFHLPDWIDQAIVLLILIGFPIALVLAWAFDATPQGIVRTDVQDHAGSPVRRRSHRAGIVVGLVGVLVAIAAGTAWWHLQRGRFAAPSSTTASTTVALAARPNAIPVPPIAAQPISTKSVAVLPFANESGDKDQQYFSDGLSEELITALSQFAGLKVINRDSSFQFRNSRDSVQAIARTLGVAHLLEGSVQRAGNEVRISAELVDAADGSTPWSQQYDRPYKDLFQLQDDITKAVASALKAELLDSGGAVVQSDRPPSGNLAAYSAYLQGRFFAQRGSEAGMRQAIAHFDDATRLDPHYAQAYAAAADAWSSLAATYLVDAAAVQHAYAESRSALATALRLNPELALAHSVRAGLMVSVDFDWSGALAEARRVTALEPGSADAQFMLGSTLARLGQVDAAVELMRQALARTPLSGGGYFERGRMLIGLGRLDEAEVSIRKAVELAPGASRPHAYLAMIGIMQGNAAAALAAAGREPAGPWHDVAMALALQIGPDRAAANAALKNLTDKDATGDSYQIAEVYALRRDPDNMFRWLERARINRDAGIELILFDPFILRYQSDPRFAAFCKKVGLPATTDAKALP